MTSRKLHELASDIEDAATVVEELQADRESDGGEKLDELQKKLEHATETIDELGEQDEKV